MPSNLPKPKFKNRRKPPAKLKLLKRHLPGGSSGSDTAPAPSTIPRKPSAAQIDIPAGLLRDLEKLSKRIKWDLDLNINPLMCVLLIRFAKAWKAKTGDVLDKGELIETDGGTLQRATFLDFEDIQKACGIPQKVVKNLRDAGILEQHRGYTSYVATDGGFATDDEMVPLFGMHETFVPLFLPYIDRNGI